MAEMGQFMAESMKSGVLLSAEGCLAEREGCARAPGRWKDYGDGWALC